MQNILTLICKSTIRCLSVCVLFSTLSSSNALALSREGYDHNIDYYSYIDVDSYWRDQQQTEDPEFQKQLHCLIENIFYESASEPLEGQIAVAQVTLNRVNSPKYPKDICGVVYQRNKYNGKTVCQFSWTCQGKRGRLKDHDRLWAQAEAVANLVYRENFVLKEFEDALFFHAAYVNPGWGLPRIKRVGNHIFYSARK